MELLKGHTSEETAFVVSDYPYGFRLRCSIRYWIETTKTGDRFCSQTSNPKASGLKWNKPKKSTYMGVMFLHLDEQGHVTYQGISKGWSNQEAIDNFMTQAGADYPWSDQQIFTIKLCKAIQAAQKYVKVDIIETTGETAEQREAREAKQAEIKRGLNNIVAHEFANATI